MMPEWPLPMAGARPEDLPNVPSGNMSRDEYFRTVREAVAEYYLADPGNPYRQSGRSSGAARWTETRRILVNAIHRDGDFMDVGCANGLLLDTLIGWARENSYSLRPHGIDFVPELIALARSRFPKDAGNFQVVNAFDWTAARRYDFVRTNLEYVPQSDWIPFVRRQCSAVAPGGRFILCHYRNVDEPAIDVPAVLKQAGYVVAGAAEAPGASAAWTSVEE